MFAKYNDPAAGGATVLVAQDGDVFIDQAFGIPAQPRYMPRTTLPQFELGDIATYVHLVMRAAAGTGGAGPRRRRPRFSGRAAEGGARQGRTATFAAAELRVARRGARWGAADGGPRFATRAFQRRRALSLRPRPGVPTTWRDADYTKGWTIDTYQGVTRLAAYATADGKRAAFVRVPDRKATIIILTNDANADARGMAERILDRLLTQR